MAKKRYVEIELMVTRRVREDYESRNEPGDVRDSGPNEEARGTDHMV
jgi:hypothetical protein